MHFKDKSKYVHCPTFLDHNVFANMTFVKGLTTIAHFILFVSYSAILSIVIIIGKYHPKDGDNDLESSQSSTVQSIS